MTTPSGAVEAQGGTIPFREALGIVVRAMRTTPLSTLPIVTVVFGAGSVVLAAALGQTAVAVMLPFVAIPGSLALITLRLAATARVGRARFTFAAGGVSAANAGSVSQATWDVISVAWETPSAFVFYWGHLCVVPKEGFSSDEDVEIVRALFSSSVTNADLSPVAAPRTIAWKGPADGTHVEPPAEDGLTIRTRPTEDDIQDLLEVISPYAVSPTSGAAFVAVCVGFVASWAVAARLGSVSPLPDAIQRVALTAAVVIAGIAAFGRFQLHLVASSEPVRALLETGATYVLEDSGVHVRGPNGVSRSPWTAFARWSETERSFLIHDGGGAHLLPKASLSRDDAKRVRALLAKHLKQRGLSSWSRVVVRRRASPDAGIVSCRLPSTGPRESLVAPPPIDRAT